MQTTSSIWQPDAAICADGERPADNISIHSAAVRRMLTDGQYDTAIDYLQTLADSCRQNSTFRRHARDIVTRIILVVTDVPCRRNCPSQSYRTCMRTCGTQPILRTAFWPRSCRRLCVGFSNLPPRAVSC